MNTLTALVLLLSVVTAQQQLRLSCGRFGVQTRKSWVSMTTREKNWYLSRYKMLMKFEEGDPSFVDKMTDYHYRYAGYMHGSPQFFPWHRYFLSLMEQELQKNSPRRALALPYWDWVSNPTLAAADIWDYFGTKDGEITDGLLKDHYVNTPNPHKQERSFWGGTATSAELMPAYLNLRSFGSFWNSVEGSPHASVHINIGGDMGTMYSPNDPLFYLHHCMIDKIWAVWQSRSPDNFNAYSGTQWVDNSDPLKGSDFSNTKQASLSDPFVPFDEWTVKDVLDTTVLCYRYDTASIIDTAPSPPPTPTTTRPSTTTSTRRSNPSDQAGSTESDDSPSTNNPSTPNQASGDARKDDLSEIFTQTLSGKIVKGSADVSTPSSGTKGSASIHPADEYVTVYPVNDPEVSAQNATELFRLSYPTTATDEWIKSNKLNATYVRTLESNIKETVDKINSEAGYVSKSALWYRPGAILNLIKRGQKYFKATVNNGVVYVTLRPEDTPSVETVESIKARILKTLRVDGVEGGYGKCRSKVESYLHECTHKLETYQ